MHCEIDKFSVSFFDRNYSDNTENIAEKILKEINMSDEFMWNKKRFFKHFKFPAEEEIMYNFLNLFLKKLREVKR